jgi:UDP-N-acetylmuramoyl-tripeptide--D-alanyl-D-alanine ligase
MTSGRPMMTLAQAQTLLPAATLVGAGATAFERVHSDSRTLRAGDLFVALAGERYDGHDFLPAARAAGAVAALAARGLAEAGLPGLQVADPLAALQQLAAGWRRHLHLPLLAVTGSNGKTTVTQMVGAILRAWHGEGGFATQGNLNNHIGVPLTLLRLRQDDGGWHRAGVVELGMNHPGETAQLAALVQPQAVLVNNAQREHQEFMASVDAVAREHGSAIDALGAAGVAVLPADDAYAPLWRAQAGARRCLCFALADAAGGAAASADVRAQASWVDASAHWDLRLQTPAGAVATTLRIAGRHHAKNAAAAAAGALALGAPLAAVAAGLAAFEPAPGRSQLHRRRRGGQPLTVVDDSYNANPDSVRAAIDLLAGLGQPGWLLLGDMGEVGAQGPQFHAEVGAWARARGIAALWTVGPLSAHAAQAYGASARHFADVEALLAALAGRPPARALLVKGSRFMRMERIVQALLADTEEER